MYVQFWDWPKVAQWNLLLDPVLLKEFLSNECPFSLYMYGSKLCQFIVLELWVKVTVTDRTFLENHWLIYNLGELGCLLTAHT